MVITLTVMNLITFTIVFRRCKILLPLDVFESEYRFSEIKYSLYV